MGKSNSSIIGGGEKSTDWKSLLSFGEKLRKSELRKFSEGGKKEVLLLETSKFVDLGTNWLLVAREKSTEQATDYYYNTEVKG